MRFGQMVISITGMFVYDFVVTVIVFMVVVITLVTTVIFAGSGRSMLAFSEAGTPFMND